ncbi:MAG: 16S rRNA (cytidine(1402)-2'-O)-methyltransferase [Caldicoprobacterales bacterium]|jgi:16S rRNA (cytidine1402-2'-O)-methyltransferase|nr:16S rRNA (cytidine(1402)-2'-O)-methyltransferase [Clostridiales bacterium]
MGKGTLYLCATPIGNLEDITLRVIRTLEEVDYIVAEDTRHTLKLLNHLNISKPLISYHKFSDKKRVEEILTLLEDGNDIALVSDAGMPGISDPGEDLVRLAYQWDIPVTVLPGATAGLSALVLSGLPSGRFVFEGFLPREKREMERVLALLKSEERTIVLYEAPHRLTATLKKLYKALGNRSIAVIRELTKIHEEVLRFTLEEAIEYFTANKPRGEFVLVLEGSESPGEDNDFDDIPISHHIMEYMKLGLSKKEAIKKVAEDRNLPKSEVYPHSIHLPLRVEE